MKKIEAYQCDFCGVHYLASGQAITCENNHVSITDLTISEAKYSANEDTWDTDFPTVVRVEIDGRSGHLAEYKFVRDGSVEEFEPFVEVLSSDVRRVLLESTVVRKVTH